MKPTRSDLAIVGVGCRAGQISVGGAKALAGAGWTGFYGLPAELRFEVEALVRVPVDLDKACGEPLGFVHRLCDVVLGAALELGTAAVAVQGHPTVGNPATPFLVQQAQFRGISATVYPAPSILDDYMAYTGEDLLTRAICLVDARSWVQQSTGCGPHALAIWNTAYLSQSDSDGLQVRLWQVFGMGQRLRLYHSGQRRTLEDCWLDPAGSWRNHLSSETTVFIY